MKKIFLFLTALLMVTSTYAAPIEATPIESLSSYTGTDPFVYDMTARKYYAYNNLGVYEEFGLYPEVSTLKVAGGGATEIEYLKSPDGAYINLNYIPKANSKAICTMVAETGGDWKAAYGCGYERNGWRDRFCFFTTNATINLGGETGNRDAMAYGRKIVTVLDAVAGKMDIFEEDGTTLIGTITDSPKTEDCKTPLYVFAQNKDYPDGSRIQTDCYNPFVTIYSLQLYEGETLVMDLVPIVDGEGKGGLKDKLTGTVYTSANDKNFELSADGQAIAADAGISVYPGKLVINTADQHEYKWNGTEWVDLGSVYKPIADTNYQNMNNWTCRFGFDTTYDNIENTNGNDNFFNPYKGEGGWEPYQVKITGLTKGDTYRFSFNFTSEGWTSWDNGRWAALPVFVTNNWDFPQNDFYPTSVGGSVLGYTTLPKAAVTDQPYSFSFTADGTEATLAINFGVVSDDYEYRFHFDNLMIDFADYPEKYDITWTDPNKYTPLEYIESTSAARENVFTTPYIAKASTKVALTFQSYSGGDWRAIFSGRNGGDASTGISLYQNGNQQHFGYFVGGYRKDDHAPYPGHNQDITVEASLSNLKVNGTDYATGQTTFNASSRKISLFANPEWDQAFRGRIYYFNISEGDESIFEFNPVMRHDGKIGYYDAATATFIQPVQGNWNGYGFKLLDTASYIYFTNEQRIAIVGTPKQFLPTVQNLDAVSFTWASSDENVATVAADGTVTGKAAGKVTITATTDADEGWTASYELTVSEPNYVRKDYNNVGYAIVIGGNGWGDSPLSALLDNDARTKFGCSNAGEAWAIMVASEPVAVSEYSFITGADTYDYPARNPRSWKLEGSNDNQTWTLIDEHSDFDAYKIYPVNKEEFVFNVNGTEKYKFFKFSATSTGDGFQLGEFWVNGHNHEWGEPTEETSTCTTNGKLVYECSDCHALTTKVLPLADHNYVDGVCSVCGAKEKEPVLLANGQTNPYMIKFRHAAGSARLNPNPVDIESGWNTAEFDDSQWDELMMPIGSNGYDNGARNGAKYNTIWFNEDNTYWFRRPFYVEKPTEIKSLTLKLLHDDAVRVFVNGTEVFVRIDNNPWTGGTEWLNIEVEPSLLVAGTNVVAIYIEQNFGGAYCDFSLEAVRDQATGISQMEDGRWQMEDVIYDLSGRQIVARPKGTLSQSEATERNCKSVNSKLSHGVYIVNGKKVIR